MELANISSKSVREQLSSLGFANVDDSIIEKYVQTLRNLHISKSPSISDIPQKSPEPDEEEVDNTPPSKAYNFFFRREDLDNYSDDDLQRQIMDNLSDIATEYDRGAEIETVANMIKNEEYFKEKHNFNDMDTENKQKEE